MQINDFTGGLNLRLAPHLIGQNEGSVYKNINTIKGALAPLNLDTNLDIAMYKYIYNFKDIWISSDSYKDYVEFQEKLYYSDGISIPQKSSNGITYQNLGIKKPSTKPTISFNTGTVPFTGTYQYCYTYYNNIDGTESQPSAFSLELSGTGASINVTIIASTDTQVDKIKIYRLGNNISLMSLVAIVSNVSQTYIDTLADTAIDGSVLDSYTNGQAPVGLNYLTEANAMLFGSVKDKLWFSDVAYVNYWSEFNYIDFDSEITGIGNTQNGLLVFTKYKTYIVTGNSPSTLSKYLLDGNQGCISHRSIAFAKNTLVWASSDGICASSGGVIEVISRVKLDKISITNVKDSIVLDDVYYLSYDTTTLMVDFRFGLVFSNLDISPDSFFLYNDIAYYSNTTLHSMFTSTLPRNIEFTSGLYSDGSITNLKNYKTIYINSTGDLTLSTYIDNVLVGTQQLLNGVDEIKLPQQARLGYSIRFSITGTGIVNEIEYKAEGRQNGR